jgi:hypothetical protein
MIQSGRPAAIAVAAFSPVTRGGANGARIRRRRSSSVLLGRHGAGAIGVEPRLVLGDFVEEGGFVA